MYCFMIYLLSYIIICIILIYILVYDKMKESYILKYYIL